MRYGLYQKIQKHNLARYLRVKKTTVIPFTVNHPYLKTERFLSHYDKTQINIEEQKDDDKVKISFLFCQRKSLQ